MLVIREEQYRRLLDRQQRDHVEWALERVRKARPQEYARLGEHGMRELIRQSMVKAELYDIHNPGHTQELLELMLTWGADFDLDQRLPWAGATLRWDAPEPAKMQTLRVRGERAKQDRAQELSSWHKNGMSTGSFESGWSRATGSPPRSKSGSSRPSWRATPGPRRGTFSSIARAAALDSWSIAS